MKRFFIAAALFLAGVGAASADYVLIKVDLNKMNFFPAVGGGSQVNPAAARSEIYRLVVDSRPPVDFLRPAAAPPA